MEPTDCEIDQHWDDVFRVNNNTHLAAMLPLMKLTFFQAGEEFNSPVDHFFRCSFEGVPGFLMSHPGVLPAYLIYCISAWGTASLYYVPFGNLT